MKQVGVEPGQERNVALRTVPRLVVLDDAEPWSISVKLGDRSVASAWRLAAGDQEAWLLWNGNAAPYCISGGRAGALELLADRREVLERREESLWRGSPEPGGSGRMDKAPDGVPCVGCGQDMTGDLHVSLARYVRDGEETRHFICANCECYLDED